MSIFDEVIDRKGTNSSKWSVKDELPMWVADMDFKAPKPILDVILKRLSLCGNDRDYISTNLC